MSVASCEYMCVFCIFYDNFYLGIVGPFTKNRRGNNDGFVFALNVIFYATSFGYVGCLR